MDISLIVLIGFPVLYLTGSLRKAVAAAGIRGVVFVLYFTIASILSLVPRIQLLPWVSLDLAGVFMSVAPAVYVLRQHGYSFHFFLAASITILLSVTAYFVTNTLTLPYLSPFLGFAVSAVAALCHGRRAPEYAPVLAGLFGLGDSAMALLSDSARAVALFDVREMVALSFAVCLCVAFFSVCRPRGKHAAGYRHRGVPPEASAQ
jgi:hypothetical protein